jgi:hypothetical protein
MKHPCLNLDTQEHFQTGNLDITGAVTGRKALTSGSAGRRPTCPVHCSKGVNYSDKGMGTTPGNVAVLFINTDSNETISDMIKTATPAHESGHNLGLQHVFENKNDNDAGVCKVGNKKLPDSRKTNNIMDYQKDDSQPDNRNSFFKYQINHLKTK